LGLAFALLWLLSTALRDSHASDESTIVDHVGNPYQIKRLSSRWTGGFAIVVFLCLAFLGYGVYEYYQTQPFLNEYPLGYAIFDMDTITGAVTPEQVRKGLETYQFDFTKVRIIENTASRIAIQLPDLLKDQKLILSQAQIGGDRITMQKFGAGYAFGDGTDSVMATGQVLRYQGSRIIWILGFRRLSSHAALVHKPLPLTFEPPKLSDIQKTLDEIKRNTSRTGESTISPVQMAAIKELDQFIVGRNEIALRQGGWARLWCELNFRVPQPFTCL
jgi:hypothetical protein